MDTLGLLIGALIGGVFIWIREINKKKKLANYNRQLEEALNKLMDEGYEESLRGLKLSEMNDLKVTLSKGRSKTKPWTNEIIPSAKYVLVNRVIEDMEEDLV